MDHISHPLRHDDSGNTSIAIPNETVSAEWWTQPRNVSTDLHLTAFDYFSFAPPEQAAKSQLATPPRDPTKDPQLLLDDDPVSSPAAMFLSGFASPDRSVRASTLPEPTVLARRPHCPRLEVDHDHEVVAGYRLGAIIGHGAFSTIRRATALPINGMSPGAVVAVKIVRKDDTRVGASEARLNFAHEVKVWSQLSHEHILPLFQSVETLDATYFFTMYCPAGSLLDVINAHRADGLDAVGMDDAGMLFRQIIRGLKYLHEVVYLVHGDIKLENILVDDQGSCRIADFGLSKWMEQRAPTQASNDAATRGLPVHLSLLRSRGRHRTGAPFVRPHAASESSHPPDDIPTHPQHCFPPGSLPYAAPELLAPQTASQTPSPAQDIWAVGCVLYALLFGKLPFSDPFEPRLQMKIVRGIWKLPSNCRQSVPPRTRIRSLSRSRSRNRATFARPQARDQSKGPISTVKSPTSAAFVSPATVRIRSKSRGRLVPERSPSPAPRRSSKAIGRVAENVLRGCLCVSVFERWSVSMIDEVGWGVGWDLDVDEACEEFDDPEGSSGSEDMSRSASTSSANSGVVRETAETHHDRFGNRYYVTPSAQASYHNALFSSTLDLVTSPVQSLSPSTAETVATTPVHPGLALQRTPVLEAASLFDLEKSRGQLGTGSRSSSRASSTANLIAHELAPSLIHPSQQGPVAPPEYNSLGPLSQPSSVVPSRAPSREHDTWTRGRPINPVGATSWRGSSPAFAPSASLPIQDSELSCIQSWGLSKAEDSVSPSPSPSPCTPIDNTGARTSASTLSVGRSRGRDANQDPLGSMEVSSCAKAFVAC